MMEMKAAIEALGALAQESRLGIFRLLVEAGPDGVAASDIAGEIGIPPNTLSFHVKTLRNAGLVTARQEGRFVFYSANYRQMTELLQYLTESCCRGSEKTQIDGSNAA